MRTWWSLSLAYDHVRAGLGRMALSIFAVALGVALVVAIKLMNEAVLNSFLDTVDAVAGRAALTVTAGEGFTFGEELVEVVGRVPGVKLAVPLVRGSAALDDGSGDLLTVHGVDLTHEAAVRLYHAQADPTEVIDDVMVFLSQPDSIVLGKEFASRRGLRTGDKLSLVTPRGVKSFTVRGLLEAQGLARTLDGRLVVMDLYAAERAFTADGQISQIDLTVTDPNALERTKTAVAAVLPPGLRVEEPVLRKEVIRKTVAGFQTMIAAFSLLAVLAGFVICYSRLSAIFESRTWEIGLLRAVGLRRIVVFVELLKESLLLGSAGTAIGIPLGIAIAHYGLPIAARTSAIVFRLPVAAAVVTARWDVVILGAGVGLLAAFLAASAPALRLARTEPVAALTMRGRDTQAVAPRFSTSLAPGLFLLSGAVAVFQHLSHLRALGLVTTGLVAFGVCASAATVVRYGGRVLAPLLRCVFGPTGEFAAGHLVQHPRRISLTVASLGAGLGAVLMFGMLAWSFERTLVSRLTASFRAPLIVSSAHLGVGYRSAPISDHLVDELAALPGVHAVGGEQSTDIEFADGVVVLKSYDATCFRDPMVHDFPLDSGALPDALGLVGRGQAVLVSSAFAYQHGTRPGDTIHFRSPNGPLAFTVAAVASQPENAITLVRDQYAKFWNDSHVYLVHVALNPAADPSAVRTIIAKTLGTKYRVQVRSTAALVDYFAEQVRQGFSILYPLEAIAFVLLLVGVGDTLGTGVLERTKEFAMMRAVGLQQSRLLLIVMLEGVGIGVLGLILALAAGVVLGLFWTAVQFPAMMGFRLDPHFPSSFALTAAALTIFICLAGSLLPSLRAARLSVVEGLRNE